MCAFFRDRDEEYQIILDGVLQENPFFVPPDEFLRDLRTRRPLPDRGSSR